MKPREMWGGGVQERNLVFLRKKWEMEQTGRQRWIPRDKGESEVWEVDGVKKKVFVVMYWK